MARRWTAARAMITVLIAAVVVLLGMPPGLSSAAISAAPAKRVVVIGVPGLQWSDLSASGTPSLWKMTGSHAAAALSVRTTTNRTCPMDGWLTISAGQRARLANGSCALPPAPTTAPASPGASGAAATVPGWDRIAEDNAGTDYQAKVGLLGDSVHKVGGCTLAVGPGGVFGAADTFGRVDTYVASPDKVADWGQCALTMVDIDDVFRAYIKAGVDSSGAQAPVSPEERAAAATEADRRVGEVLAKIPAGTSVLIAGLADATGTPHLHVALGSGDFQRGYLTANSTRREGLVTLTDVSATVLSVLGLERPGSVVGSDWRSVPSRDEASTKVDALHDQDVAAQQIRRLGGVFFIALFGVQLLMYGFAAIALRRRSFDRRRILSLTRTVALAGAATPVATYLANLVPWWRAPHPAPALLAAVAVATAVVTGFALSGPWRRSVIGPGLTIAALTALVLGLDVVTGSDLQINAFMGYTALVAGRFYGFGNMAFAVFATATILSASWLAEGLLKRGRRDLAVMVVVLIGLITMIVAGTPGWGSDFGSVVPTVLGTAVLGLLISGRRVSVLRLGLLGLAGGVIVLGMSFADSLRAEPTHLGRFWDQLLAGEAWAVIGRKFGAMLRSFGYWPFTVVAIAALLFLFFVLARPMVWRAAALQRAYQYSDTLRPALFAALTIALGGMLMNDSGVVIPALALTLAVPLVLAACVRALELDAAECEGTSRSGLPERSPSQTA